MVNFLFNNGTQRSLPGNAIPVKNADGHPNGAVATFMEVTEIKKMYDELGRFRDELGMRVRDRTAQLQESKKRLLALATELINAQETERKRIAHELHDSLAAQVNPKDIE